MVYSPYYFQIKRFNIFINLYKKIKEKSAQISSVFYSNEELKVLHGKMLSELLKNKPCSDLTSVEFKVFSQFGDDGIIQYLINNIDIPNNTFIEFGVSNYLESNTHFLLKNNNWSGYVLDSSIVHINTIVNSHYYWKYDLVAKQAFITKQNIETLIMESNFNTEVGLLHIDLDGNDYYIWESITCINPAIVVIEYNSLFGMTRPISIPYTADFDMYSAHFSTLYWGASLLALCHLAETKNYSFIGCNSSGNNAYFVRNDKLNNRVTSQEIQLGFKKARFRSSRNKNKTLSLLSYTDSVSLIKGLPVYNVLSQTIESF